MMKKHTIQLLVIFLAGALLNGCESGEEQTPQASGEAQPAAEEKTAEPSPSLAADEQSDCELTMGWDPWVPYHYRDITGNVQGLDVELVEAMAREVGCTMDYREGEWNNLIGLLREGEIDLLTGASRVPERTEFAHFSRPYRTEVFQLFVRAGEVDDYTGDTLKALLDNSRATGEGAIIGITSGYYYGTKIEKLLNNPEYKDMLRDASVGEVNYSRLLDHEIDGFLEEPVVAAHWLRIKGIEDDIEGHPLVLNRGEVHLMFSKTAVETAMVERFNNALDTIRSKGTYRAIMKRYGAHQRNANSGREVE